MGAHPPQASLTPIGWRRLLLLFGGTVASQGVLSAASLLTSLLLIRHASTEQYGSFVLVVTAILLAASLQSSYLAPPLLLRLSAQSPAQRGHTLSALWREQRRVIAGGAALVVILIVLVAALVSLSAMVTGFALAGTLATACVLRREFFRLATLSQRDAFGVLRADALFAVLFVAGAALAILGRTPGLLTSLCMGLAALASGSLLAARLRRRLDWPEVPGDARLLRSFAAIGSWSAFGAAIHWGFGQSYNVLAAVVLDLHAVAMIAATRLVLMPVNLLSVGVGSLLLPLTTGWLPECGAATVARRLFGFGLALLAAAAAYDLLLWLARDWIFGSVLQQDFAQRDPLLLLWMACLAVAVLRDALLHLAVAAQRQRTLTALAAVSAASAILTSVWAMHRWGAIGAPCGVLVGELISLGGLAALYLNILSQQRHAAGTPVIDGALP